MKSWAISRKSIKLYPELITMPQIIGNQRSAGHAGSPKVVYTYFVGGRYEAT